MSLLRTTTLRTALQPSSRLLLPRNARPFLTTSLRQAETRDDKWYEPNDGGKSKQNPGDKGTSSGGYRLDGTSAASSNRSLMYIGGITAVLAGIYFFGLAKPDTAVAADLKHDTDAVKHRTGSERQRKGGPERSEK